jgi:hypothetical protein
MTAKPSLKLLKTASAKAAARAAAAKGQVRLAKAQLKQARKVFKAAKRAAKQARRQVDAAGSSRPRRPAATLKLKPAIRKASSAPKSVRAPKTAQPKPAVKKTVPRVSKARLSKARVPKALAPKARGPKVPPMRSAAEIAKTVIDRLHAPPPILPPAPIIPPDTKAISDASAPETSAHS